MNLIPTEVDKFSSKHEQHQENSTIRRTNFSIEHILNKAGSTPARCNYNNTSHYACRIQDESLRNKEKTLSDFQWLHCTRYQPPKLPRNGRTAPSRRTPGRLPRIPFSPSQLKILEDSFLVTPYLSSQQASILANTLHLSDTRVKIWFQNRRARVRRENSQTQIVENTERQESSRKQDDVSSAYIEKVHLLTKALN